MSGKKEYIQIFNFAISIWKSQKIPRWAKVLAVIFAILIISPIDFIPDVLPVIGWIDDISMFVWIVVYFYSKLKKKKTKRIDQ